MSFREINLGEEEVLKLNYLFSAVPYGVTKDVDSGYIAYVWTGERDEAFMNYDVNKIIVYGSKINSFPKPIIQDLLSRLRKIKSLEKIVNTLEDSEKEIF